MNWLDIVIIVAIAIPTIIGLRIGIIKAAFSLAGLIAGIILAGYYYIPLSERLSFISPTSVAEIVAFAIILIVVVIITAFLALLLRRVASIMMLSWVNHLGGAIFGFVLGSLFCGALLAAYIKFFGETPPINESHLTTILLYGFSMVLALLPEPIRSFFIIVPGSEFL
ncbi:MAG TPA: CvpA family protein [Dehalococcoidia bacterium]|nr:CvpA family protein [Dehalococcoidia bacterium]